MRGFEIIGEQTDEVRQFVEEWLNDSDMVEVQTSGSTGAPKRMMVQKERMRTSARMTLSYLGLKPGDTAHLCMSPRYIAGKMMIVRAIEGGLRLIVREPSSRPLQELDAEIDFSAMVPMQVHESLLNDVDRERLMRVKRLIIGGGAVSDTDKAKLAEFPNMVYSSYGMTETLSHIALQLLSTSAREKAYREISPDISISSRESQMVITAPMLGVEDMLTNDIVEISEDGSFTVVGRVDNVICTGGIKVQIEEVERRIAHLLSCDYAITSEPDDRLGNRVVLVVTDTVDEQTLYDEMKRVLPRYWDPKQIIRLDSIPKTETDKVARRTLIERLRDLRIEKR